MHPPCKYRLPDKNSDLEQGDILEPTPDLRSILRIVHPHFCDPKYLGFMVLTQTCDLVRGRRGDFCSSKYVTIAAVRLLSDCLPALLAQVCTELERGVYDKHSKRGAKQLLRRVVNQNEQKLGLFYLYPDVDTIGIAEHAVAVLQVSVALRADEHYPTLLDARCGSLEAPFQSKLGWLVGNLFSRVATPDWSNKDRDKLINELIGNCSPKTKWMSKDEVEAATQAGVNLTELSEEEAKEKLKPHLPKPPREQVVEEVIAVTQQVFGKTTSGEDITKLRNRLINNPVLSSLVK